MTVYPQIGIRISMIAAGSKETMKRHLTTNPFCLCAFLFTKVLAYDRFWPNFSESCRSDFIFYFPFHSFIH